MTGANFLTIIVLLFAALGMAAYYSKLKRDTEALKARSARNPETVDTPAPEPVEAEPDSDRSGEPVLSPALVAFFVAVLAVFGAVFTRDVTVSVIAGILVGLWWVVLVVQTWSRVRAEMLRAAAAAQSAQVSSPAGAAELPLAPVEQSEPAAEVHSLREEVAEIAARVQDAPSQTVPDIAPELAMLRHEIAALSARADEAGAAGARQMQPELASLRGEIADLASMIARSQQEAHSKTDTDPEVDALRKEIAALTAQVQAAAAAPVPPPPPVVRIEKGPWLLRPVPAGLIAASLIAVTYLAAAGPEMRAKLIRIGDAPQVAEQAVPKQPSTVTALSAPPPSAVARPETRVALVIGNGAYKSAPRLNNPARDADAIVASLRSSGFQSITRHNDLGHGKMIEVLRNFASQAENADWALVYFAGHGIELGGVNYLIPVDARLASDNVVPLEAISLDNVMTSVAGARKLRMVLLDACRDNPFLAKMKRSVASRSVGRGLGRIEPEAGTLVAFAAKHGEVALDGEGQNSPFTTALARRMVVPGLEVRRLLDHVRDDVLDATKRRQQPFTYGSLPGKEDFFFVPK